MDFLERQSLNPDFQGDSDRKPASPIRKNHKRAPQPKSKIDPGEQISENGERKVENSTPKLPELPGLTNFEQASKNGSSASAKNAGILALRPYVEQAPAPISHILAALRHLKQAKTTAVQCDQDPKLFAVPLSELVSSGCAMHQLKWMAHCQFIQKTFVENEPKPHHLMVSKPEFYKNEDHFVLSESGENLIQYLERTGIGSSLESRNGHPSNGSANASFAARSLKGVPTYERTDHVLKFKGQIVKRFRWAAANQECVLRAFEDLGWPERIENPLPSDQKVVPKVRLHDTIKCLNRKQESPLLRFRGDGTGLGVIWEPRNKEKESQ